jgi:GAF domain-containing protein
MTTQPGRRIAAEQAALRRVATLVARAAAPEEVFDAVAAEAGRLLHAHHVWMARYEPDGTIRVVAAWTSAGAAGPIPVGTRVSIGGRNVITLLFQAGQPVRIDDYADATGPAGDLVRESGLRAAVGVPVSVERRLWGLMGVASTRGPLPAGTEARLAGFTDLAATAIANAEARLELRGFAEGQAALRRVAVLVARGTVPQEVFAAVAAEAGRLLGADFTGVVRYDPDGTGTVLGAWSSTGAALPFPAGTRLGPGDRTVGTLVSQTRRPARIDDYAQASGPGADLAREFGIRSSAGVPVSVEGRLWGAMVVGCTDEQPLPVGTETQLSGFTELTATAIANAQARVELRGFAEEQAALRRVAVLVGRAAPPEEVFAAVTAEAGQLLDADNTSMSRYDPDGAHTLVGIWTSTGAVVPVSIGTRFGPGGRNSVSLVFQTGRPARIDDFSEATGPTAEPGRKMGTRAGVGVPITVEGRLWGVMNIGSNQGPLPAGTEARLAGFAELAATALANAEAQAALAASRTRLVAAADQARRRIERDLHDGAQQRLVSLALELRAAQAAAPPGTDELVSRLAGAVTELTGLLEELGEIARGLHPAVLSQGGLRPALRALARRSAIPVSLQVRMAGRLPEPVEIAAYYAVSEALTNTVKHARASAAQVGVTAGEGVLRVWVKDDGRGGADFGQGSGLVGLKDRVEALGGQISLNSPPGVGTDVEITLPLGRPRSPVSGS